MKKKPKETHVPIKTRMDKQRRQKKEFAEYLLSLNPKVESVYYDNGVKITKYEAR